jgi:transketolase
MFGAHHRLGNLVAIVDANGQQALGYTRDVLDLEPLSERFAAFGWETQEVDGHDVDALVAALESRGERPRAVVARTTFGKGVSYMEGLVKWHYWPMSDADYERALAEVG